MASRQALIKPIEWSKILERVGPEMKSKVNTFKSKSDTILNNYVKANETKLAIDWDHYSKAIANKAMVQEFQQKFKALQIPKPIDNKSEELKKKAIEDEQAVQKFVKESDENLAEVVENLERLNSLPPFEQMTMDDNYEHFPRLRPDFKKYPFWPHRENIDDLIVNKYR
uniref:ATP synthase subunit d, mitochondrial n=1 Tax=Phallusia mammillata TaxID=59560 RepID=A0A6F9D6M6_9ASCI|nr:ATP synthase subunit d, mitochondrial-like [Phallusia mammillata]